MARAKDRPDPATGKPLQIANSKDSQQPERVAANICAVIALRQEAPGRFAMPVDELSKATHLPPAELEAAIAWAVEHDWLSRGSTHVELKAAGIYVAKEILDLPR
jgi:hypothetical protein